MPTQQELETKFADAGVDFTTPGLYDSPEFIEAERDGTVSLTDYGTYVRVKAQDPAQLARARTRAAAVRDYLVTELAADGRLGACIDISGVALKFLEHEGILGYIAAGSLVVGFPPQGRRKTWHHFMHRLNPAAAGHAWLVVPPFGVLDLTIQAQPGTTAPERALLAPISDENPRLMRAAIRVREVAEDELIEEFRRARNRAPQIEDYASQAMRDYWVESPPKQIELPSGVVLKYIECGVGGTEGVPIAQMQNLVLSGKNPAALHAEFLRLHPLNQDGGDKAQQSDGGH